MNSELWNNAKKMATLPYITQFEPDIYSDGTRVVLALNPELPGCMAEGSTQQEAESNLFEARIDYIYALLSEDLNVPMPMQSQSVTGQVADPKQGNLPNATTRVFVYRSSEIDLESPVDDLSGSETDEKPYSVSLLGELTPKRI